MTINAKYTVEERKELAIAIQLNAFVGLNNVPQTQEEFDAWCEKHLEYMKEEKRKQAERKAQTQERYAQAGYKTKMNWKRKGTEITKLEKEIKAMQRKIAQLERARKQLAEQYKEETGAEIE